MFTLLDMIILKIISRLGHLNLNNYVNVRYIQVHEERP